MIIRKGTQADLASVEQLYNDIHTADVLSHGCPELRMDTNARNVAARGLYKKLGYKEIGIVPTEFNGIPDVQLVFIVGEALVIVEIPF